MSHHYKLGYSHGLQGGLDAYKLSQSTAKALQTVVVTAMTLSYPTKGG